MFSTLTHLLGTFFLGIAALFGAHPVTLGAAVPTTPALFETSLASPITSTATSMTLADGTLSDGTSLAGYMCFTIDSNQPNVEYVCGTAAGTSVTNMTRGISPLTGTTTVASLESAHRRGADVKVTDYPTIGILANILRGADTIPSLLKYANTVLIGPSSASTTVATKYYVDNVAIAGAPDANTTTKGIVQFATAAQAASSTATGSTGALLALGNGIATDTPSVPQSVSGSHVIMSTIGGYLNQAWLDLTQPFTWSGAQTYNAATTFNVAPTFGTFSATSTTATSTITANLTIGNNASTTNLTVSNQCTGCAKTTIVTGTQVTILASSDAGGSASCSTGYSVTGGGILASSSSLVYLNSSYPSSSGTWSVHAINVDNSASHNFTPYAVCIKN